MTPLEMTLQQRAEHDLAMPDIFDDGYHPDRINWYTWMCVESGRIRGGRARICDFIAGMIMESGLRNTGHGSIGNNAANGTPYNTPGFASLGIGWCQRDTKYHIADLDALHAARLDPYDSLVYVTDPDNGLCRQGAAATDFNKDRWYAWTDEAINPPAGEWSPLQAAFDAYDLVTT